MKILEEVKKIIADQLGITTDKVDATSDLINDLDADSLDIVQLLIAMETEFDIEFDDDEVKQLKTVADVVRFIEERRK